MIPALTALTGIAETALMLGIAVFFRVGSAMALMPAFGERSVPMRVRLVIGLAFTLITVPAVADRLPAAEFGPWLGAEVVIGLALGAVLRLLVIALQLAGAMAAQTISLAQLFGGQAGADPQPAIGHTMVVAGLALAMILGLHVKLAAFLVLSYDLMPPGRFPLPSDLMEWGVSRVARAFSLGFALAMPFVVTSLLYNLTLGVINRAMPQLMVAFVGAPAITLGGLVLLALALPIILQVWIGVMDAFLIDPAGALR